MIRLLPRRACACALEQNSNRGMCARGTRQLHGTTDVKRRKEADKVGRVEGKRYRARGPNAGGRASDCTGEEERRRKHRHGYRQKERRREALRFFAGGVRGRQNRAMRGSRFVRFTGSRQSVRARTFCTSQHGLERLKRADSRENVSTHRLLRHVDDDLLTLIDVVEVELCDRPPEQGQRRCEA